MANRIDGEVAQIGDSGNLITDIGIERVAEIPRDESVTVKFGDHETFGIFPADHQQPDATMVASVGNSGFVEIEIVGIPLSEMLGIRTGERVTIQW